MNTDRIGRLLDSGYRAAFVLTGGGSGALHSILSRPGASRFVAEAHIPYSAEALERFLGEKPEQAVSPETARLLAGAVFNSQPAGCKPLAVACTAALQTDRARSGDDRAFVCIRNSEAEAVYALYLSKTSRAEQEALLSGRLLELTARAVGTERGLMLPGSFHPIHHGHLRLLQAAEKRTGLKGVFELSCINVDKPAKDGSDCLRQASAIRDVPVALTQAPRFLQKAALFPNTTFVLGLDTAVRLVAYAQPGEWDGFKAAGIRFLVAGRLHGGCFQTLKNLPLPAKAEPLFEAIPDSEFREDISSTDLRNGANR